jgi:hypothetical protein
MNFAYLLLGIINIFIVAAILILIGYIFVWLARLLSFDIPAEVQKIYLVIVLLICLYMLVQLILGTPITLPGLKSDALLLHHA